MIQAGKLRSRIEIQALVRNDDGAGGYKDSWKSLGNVWAALTPVSAKELLLGEQVRNTVSHKIVIRFMKDLAPTCRIVFSDRIFRIERIINPEERNERLEILCQEEVKP